MMVVCGLVECVLRSGIHCDTFFIVTVRTQHEQYGKPAFSMPTRWCLLHSMCRYHLLLLAEDLRDILRLFLPAALTAAFRCVFLKRHSFFIWYLSIIRANTTCERQREGRSVGKRQTNGGIMRFDHTGRHMRRQYTWSWLVSHGKQMDE